MGSGCDLTTETCGGGDSSALSHTFLHSVYGSSRRVKKTAFGCAKLPWTNINSRTVIDFAFLFKNAKMQLQQYLGGKALCFNIPKSTMIRA